MSTYPLQLQPQPQAPAYLLLGLSLLLWDHHLLLLTGGLLAGNRFFVTAHLERSVVQIVLPCVLWVCALRGDSLATTLPTDCALPSEPTCTVHVPGTS